VREYNLRNQFTERYETEAPEDEIEGEAKFYRESFVLKYKKKWEREEGGPMKGYGRKGTIAWVYIEIVLSETYL
jgi:hypothetical protein